MCFRGVTPQSCSFLKGSPQHRRFRLRWTGLGVSDGIRFREDMRRRSNTTVLLAASTCSGLRRAVGTTSIATSARSRYPLGMHAGQPPTGILWYSVRNVTRNSEQSENGEPQRGAHWSQLFSLHAILQPAARETCPTTVSCGWICFASNVIRTKPRFTSPPFLAARQRTPFAFALIARQIADYATFLHKNLKPSRWWERSASFAGSPPLPAFCMRERRFIGAGTAAWSSATLSSTCARQNGQI